MSFINNMKETLEDKRVLSIQSHVVYGYVGNRSSVFPLQLLKYEVDSINSVQLSNHTQYEKCTGQILSSDDLKTIFDSLKANGINKYAAILTGDNGKIYVPEELIPVYKTVILQLADVLLPNQFEAELLTGCKISDEASAIECMDMLHDYGIPTVIFSSTELHNADERGRLLTGYVSHRADLAAERRSNQSLEKLDMLGKKTATAQRIRITFPQLPGVFFGTGDLFSALTLAYLERDGPMPDLKKVFYKVQCTMQSVLRRTIKHAESLRADPNCPLPYSACYELRLIQSAMDILSPPECSSVTVMDV
uniref:Pyridoxal kinase n=1 Tax=Schistocephalus solidus TaxID=70667 RepID=A0A0X3P5M4_SCHSO